MMRRSARAILITKDKKIVLIKRTKPEKEIYYVTPGGGIEDGETPLQAVKRELKEETGSDILSAEFLFHFDDYEMQNSVDFFLCYEGKRGAPTGSEWTIHHSKTNQYEIVEVSFDALKKLNLKPEKLKEQLEDIFKKRGYSEKVI